MLLCIVLKFLVLIESDWNLKNTLEEHTALDTVVLIESDWNLKDTGRTYANCDREVLIESDWNLKLTFLFYLTDSISCINRIRLEFKGRTNLGTGRGSSAY